MGRSERECERRAGAGRDADRVVCAVVSGEGVLVPLLPRGVSVSYWDSAVRSTDRARFVKICGLVE